MKGILDRLKNEAAKTMVQVTNQVKKAENMLDFQIEEFLRSKRLKPYKEYYKYKIIKTLYLVMDYQNLVTPSAWEYTTHGVDPHLQAISQAHVTSCNDSLMAPKTECLATLLQIKFKIFYDFVAQLSFKSNNIE